jgi:hypothetical protein
MNIGNVVESALAGLAGGLLPALISLDEGRQRRQSEGGKVYGPVQTLLKDLNPEVRGINVSRTDGEEEERWSALQKRLSEVETQLQTVATSHPRRRVRDLAERTEVMVGRSFIATKRSIADLLRREPNPFRQHFYWQAVLDQRLAQEVLRELIQMSVARTTFLHVPRRRRSTDWLRKKIEHNDRQAQAKYPLD